MITIPCEYKLSPKCTGSRKVRKRYLPLIKNNACKSCASILAQRKQSISRPLRESKKDLPVIEKEIKKPFCDHYGECLTRAASVDRLVVGCNGCDREFYASRTLDVFPNIDPDEYHTLSSDLWQVKQGVV